MQEIEFKDGRFTPPLSLRPPESSFFVQIGFTQYIVFY